MNRPAARSSVPYLVANVVRLKPLSYKTLSCPFRIPSGTSKELTSLLLCLLKRDAKDRMDFEEFFHHPFIRPKDQGAEQPKPPQLDRTVCPPPVAAPSSEPSAMPPASSQPVAQRQPRATTPSSTTPPSPVAMAAAAMPAAIMGAKAASPGRSFLAHPVENPKAAAATTATNEEDDFVIVPEHLTKDAAETRKMTMRQQLQQQRVSPALSRRHTVAGVTANPRPSSLPVQPNPMPEPMPVPSMKAAYQQLQLSLAKSKSTSKGGAGGDSVASSAMSGISSGSLGPVPEEGRAEDAAVAPSQQQQQPQKPSPAILRRTRASSLSSPKSSANRQHQQVKSRRTTGPDIAQISPPALQYTQGTPPLGHRRRTSSSSSCGTPPPPVQWILGGGGANLSPLGGGGRLVPAMSPVRGGVRGAQASAGGSQTNLVPCLSPILGSPNKGSEHMTRQPATMTALMQWESGNNNSGNYSSLHARAVTVPENLSSFHQHDQTAAVEYGFRRRSAEMQFNDGRNVVVNYGVLPPAVLQRSGGSLTNLSRRPSLRGPRGAEGASTAPGHHQAALELPQIPPDLSEETLLAPEHNEVLAKLRFINQYVDAVIDVARYKAAPLSQLMDPGSMMRSGTESSDQNSRLQQLLLYMRCLHLLSQSLEFSRTEFKAKRLKPTTAVKNGKENTTYLPQLRNYSRIFLQ